MIQVLRWAEDYNRAFTRAMDLTDFAGHAERLCSAMLIDTVARSGRLPSGIDLRTEFSLLLAGYSWKEQRFRIWQSLVRRNGSFAWRAERCSSEHVVFVGSGKPAATRILMQRLAGNRRGQRFFRRYALDWEPLEILCRVIREGLDSDTGGAPQLMKVYRHMNVVPFAVPWQVEGAPIMTFLGRPLLEYERTQRLALDPDTFQAVRLWEYLPTGGSER
jgi:hypothetical protein